MIAKLLKRAMWTLRLIFENIGWKLLSLAAATTIWAFVATEPELSTFSSAPVEYKNLPNDLEIGSTPLTSVLLELRGPSGQLGGTAEASLHPQVILDMSAAAPGERTFTVGDGAVKLPRGVRLVRAVPSQVRLDFERHADASVPVVVRVTGEGHDGYFVASQNVQPSRLQIVGPASHVARVTQAVTDAVDVSQVVGTSKFRVNTFLDDPYVRFQGSPQVEVSITMKKK
jgi:YbbR domain-containing protein